MTVELETRMGSLEQRQDNADIRFEIILQELGKLKKDIGELTKGMNLLLRDNGHNLLPPTSRDEELARQSRVDAGQEPPDA